MTVINMKHVILYDKWPGVVNPNKSIPVDGWDGSSHHDVSWNVFPIGEKRMCYNDSTANPGWYTMMYLRFAEGSDYALDGNADITKQDSGSGFCTQYGIIGATGRDVTGNMGADGTNQWYLVSNDLTNACGTCCNTTGVSYYNAKVAVPAGDISGNYASTGRNNFGWFWVGGVCPVIDITSFNGDITGDDTIVQGCELMLTDDGDGGGTLGAADWSTDPEGWMPFAGVIGQALATDA